MTSTEIAETEEPKAGTLALRGDQVEWSNVQQAALAHIGIDKAPAGDQQVFMHVCQRVGLDPFAKQIYMIGRNDRDTGGKKWTIQTGIDGFRLIAERQPQYRGQVGPQWCGPDGEWRDVWLDPQKPPVAARVGVLRADREEPVWGVALFREYAQTTTYNNQTQLTKMWRDKGAHMVAKCAEALAVRRAFPQEIGGLVTDDEMNAAPAGAPPADQRPAAVTADELTGKTPPRPDSTAGEEGRAAHSTGSPEAPPSDYIDGELVDEDQAAGEEAPAAEPAQGHADPEQPERGPKANDVQIRRIGAMFGEANVSDQDRHLLTGVLLDREVTSWDELTVADASQIVNRLNDMKKAKHEHGLAGAVDDLLNAAEQKRMEAEAAEQEGGDQAATDDAAAGES